MTGNDIFKAMLQDPILRERYELSDEDLAKFNIHDEPSNSSIIEVIKIVIQGVENETPDRSVNTLVKSHFNL